MQIVIAQEKATGKDEIPADDEIEPAARLRPARAVTVKDGEPGQRSEG